MYIRESIAIVKSSMFEFSAKFSVLRSAEPRHGVLTNVCPYANLLVVVWTQGMRKSYWTNFAYNFTKSVLKARIDAQAVF